MSGSLPGAGEDPAARGFAALERLLPFVRAIRERLGERGHRRIDGIYWILALLGTLPAVRAELLFPTSWIAQLGGGLDLAGAENVFGHWALLIAGMTAVLAILLQRSAGLWAAVPYSLLAASNVAEGPWLASVQNAYALSALVIFAYFIIRGRTRSLYFLLYIVGLALAQKFDALLTWDRITTFVVVSIAASLVHETWRQNRPMLRELGRQNVVGLLLRTLSLWSPTILLIAAGLTISTWMTAATEEMIYEGTFVEKHCSIVGNTDDVRLPCPDSGSWLAESAIHRQPLEIGEECYYAPYREAALRRTEDDMLIEPSSPYPTPFPCPAAELADDGRYPVERLPFEISLDLSVARQFEVVDWRAKQQLAEADQAALRQSRRAGPEARELFTVVPQTPGISIASCEWYDLKCHIVGAVKRSLINAYVRGRARAERAFVEQMQARADALAAGVTDTTESIDTILSRNVRNWSDSTRTVIARVFTVHRVVNALAMLWLVVIAIKSFLYVFGRVIFDRKTDVHIDLADDDTQASQGTVEHVTEVTIPGGYGYDIYYKSNYQPLGPAPRFTIPQPFASALSRLRFGAWNLSRIPMPCDDERGLTFNSVQADYLVDWQLQEGEEVVFNYRNFVAMNENVELRTIVSLRVSSLLLGRIVFHSARCKGGPGRLILRTRGRPATAEQVRRSIPMSRLIAWNTFARFSIDSHLTHADIFMNGFNLRRSESAGDGKPTGIVIVEADARDGGVLFGTLRFAKHFLLPV